jgi:hypothetical protein
VKKYSYTKLVTLVYLIFFYYSFSFPEGFAGDTFIKTPHGYTKIKDLSINDSLLSYDANNNCIESTVTDITKKVIDHYVRLTIADECISIASDQLLYDESHNSWVIAALLKNDDLLKKHKIKVELINESIDVYLISIANYHNFLVTKKNICAHNFFPPIVLGLSIAFGSGGLEIAGISCGFAGLGAFLGYKWRQKHKQSKFVIEPMQFDISQQSNDIVNTNDSQAPGMPTENDGFYPPKKWDGKKVKNPKGPGYGWPDRDGNIWIPTGPKGHGGPHWDVQISGGKKYRNILPGGKER